jgi:hypothetical protein
MDLLITYIHHSELLVITAPLLFSTILRSPQHPLSLFPVCCVFNRPFLATASHSGDSAASRSHVDTDRRISHNWTLFSCHLNYSTISSQPSLQSSTQLPNLNWIFRSPTNYYTSLNWTAISRLYSLGADPTEKPPPTVLQLFLWAVA